MDQKTLLEALHLVGTPLCKEAAKEIEHLRNELKRLKAAAGHPKDDGPGG